MSVGTAAIIGGTTLAAGGIGAGLGKRKARKLAKELEGTAPGQALAVETQRAAGRAVSGKYGMSDAERRKTAGQIAEAPREEARQVRRQMLTEVAKGGMLGRSGSTIAALTGLERAVAESGAKAGGQAAQASQQAAALQKAQDVGTLDKAMLAEIAKQGRRDRLAAIGRQRGAEFGAGLARAGLGDIGTISSAAGPADAAAGKVG